MRGSNRPASKTSWENVSDWYAGAIAKPDSYQQTVLFPNALRLLAPERGGTYLDVACGDGSFAIMIAKKTHANVVGIDASPSLLARASSRNIPKTEFVLADAQRFASHFPLQCFDGATCILAAQNVQEIEPMFHDVSRTIKRRASFVVVVNHPCFRQPRQSGWGWDERRKIQFRRLDRYLTPYESPILAHPGSAPDVKTFSFHRPLSSYVTSLYRTGFVITAMEEWTSPKQSDSGPRAQAENVARGEFPLFLALRARLA